MRTTLRANQGTATGLRPTQFSARAWARTLLGAAALALAALGSLPGRAHEGAEQEIAELTDQMKVQGPSADLLIQRATEFKVLGNFADAAKDLEHALELDHESVTARRELGQAYFALGKTNEALSTVTRGLKSPADPAEEASLLVVRAGILRARRDYTKALTDLTEAIGKYPENVEWYLIRSQLQALLKLKSERVKGLEEGIQRTGGGLLVEEWIDALIEDGQYTKALEKVNAELEASRWRAAWLIRRAKIFLATGKSDGARADLAAAIQELNGRLSTGAPDAQLLVDRAVASELLGKKEEARRDYRAARDKGFSAEWLRERIRSLRDSANDEE